MIDRLLFILKVCGYIRILCLTADEIQNMDKDINRVLRTISVKSCLEVLFLNPNRCIELPLCIVMCEEK